MKVESVILEYKSRCVSNPECRQLNDEEVKVLTQVLKQFKKIILEPFPIGGARKG